MVWTLVILACLHGKPCREVETTYRQFHNAGECRMALMLRESDYSARCRLRVHYKSLL